MHTPRHDGTPPIQPDPVDLLRQRLEADLRQAIKDRETLTVRTLRSVIGRLDNASAVEQTAAHTPVYGRSADVPRRVLTLEEIHALLRSEANERKAASAQYEQLGQSEHAARLRAESVIVERYLGL